MPEEFNEVEKQIEAGYDYRGHVTITFKSGEKIEGFIANRQFPNPKLKEDNFIEVHLKGSGEVRRYPIPSVLSVELTGKDWALVNPYVPPAKKP